MLLYKRRIKTNPRGVCLPHMHIDLKQYVRRFEQEWEDKPITFRDEEEDWQEESDLLFEKTSSAIKSRNYRIQNKNYLKSVDGNSRINEITLI